MANALHPYQEKRDFDKTAEPRGEAEKTPAQGLRFVVQHHVASRDHYDFRLEWEGVLKSWAVPKGPSYSHLDKRLAVQVEDHPLAYRHFEGTIPKGQYGGGTVMIWDEGTWYPLENAEKGFETGSLKFTLDGTRLRGKWALVRMKPKPGEKTNNWLLIKEPDEYENAFDIRQFDTSVTTGRTMEEIAKGGEAEKEPEMERKKPSPKANIPDKGAKKKDGAGDIVVGEVRISSPDKMLYPESGITKGDVARYYQKVSVRMMPYIQNRVLSEVRCPGGIESACFYKKHPMHEKQGVETMLVPSDKGEPEEYVYVTEASGLLGEVQMNTLEFHPWGSRVETLEKPDIMVFDLDPDEGLDIEDIRRGVRDLKGMLDQLSLVSYLKTSGGKGYHIVLPFQAAAGWEAFHAFAQNIAKAMEAMWPDRYTSNVRKNQRRGRIFVDWLRNGRGATSVAPYSLRARAGAPVSMPIAWKELDAVAPQDIHMAEAEARLKRKDPWEGFFDQKQELK